jgi:hypothetical protein
MVHHVVSQKLTDVSEVPTASIIALMMQAVRTFETSVNIYESKWCTLPEESHVIGLLWGGIV